MWHLKPMMYGEQEKSHFSTLWNCEVGARRQSSLLWLRPATHCNFWLTQTKYNHFWVLALKQWSYIVLLDRFRDGCCPSLAKPKIGCNKIQTVSGIWYDHLAVWLLLHQLLISIHVCRRLQFMMHAHQIGWRMWSQQIAFIFFGEHQIQPHSAQLIRHSGLRTIRQMWICIITTKPQLYAN